MKRILYFIPLLVAFISCTKGPQEVIVPGEQRVRCTPYVSCSGMQTKSQYTGGESDINSINIWAYLDGKLDAQLYRTNTGGAWYDSASQPSDLSLHLYQGKEYVIYALANTGKVTPPVNESEVSTISYSITSYTDMFSRGLPMSRRTTFTPSSSSSTFSLPLERLVAKYTFTFAKGVSTEDVSLTVTGMRLKNAPAQVAPFSSTSKATSVIGGDEGVPVEPVDGTVTYYVLENMQGTATGISDPKDKSAANITSGGLDAGLCTYVEVEGTLDYNEPNGNSSTYLTSRDILYRYYLGEDNLGNCDIRRNTAYTSRFIYSNYGWMTETYRAELLDDVLDQTYTVFICDDHGRPQDFYSIDAKDAEGNYINETFKVYFKAFPTAELSQLSFNYDTSAGMQLKGTPAVVSTDTYGGTLYYATFTNDNRRTNIKNTSLRVTRTIATPTGDISIWSAAAIELKAGNNNIHDWDDWDDDEDIDY